jgi:hypothetical protein
MIHYREDDLSDGQLILRQSNNFKVPLSCQHRSRLTFRSKVGAYRQARSPSYMARTALWSLRQAPRDRVIRF